MTEDLDPIAARADATEARLSEDFGIENVVIDDINIYLTETMLGIGFMLQDPEGNRFNIRDIGGVR